MGYCTIFVTSKISKMFLLLLCLIMTGSLLSNAQMAKIHPALLSLAQKQDQLDYIVIILDQNDDLTSGLQPSMEKE